jgi:hypothetical protein
LTALTIVVMESSESALAGFCPGVVAEGGVEAVGAVAGGRAGVGICC